MANRKKAFDELEGGDIQQHVLTHGTTLSFPEKLMYMMMAVEKQTATAATRPSRAPVVWDPTGTTVVVLASKELEDVWFPKFFGTSCKFKSFARKLYRWGFKKVRYDDPTSTDEAGTNMVRRHTLCFQHPCFRRDEKNLLHEMENTTCDKTKRVKAREEVQRLIELEECKREERAVNPQQIPPLAASTTGLSTFQQNQNDVAGLTIQRQLFWNATHQAFQR